MECMTQHGRQGFQFKLIHHPAGLLTYPLPSWLWTFSCTQTNLSRFVYIVSDSAQSARTCPSASTVFMAKFTIPDIYLASP